MGASVEIASRAEARRGRGGEIPAVLTAGFATTVAMWAAAYFLRLPAVVAPSPLVLLVLLLCLLAGGYVLGRTSGGSWAGGAAVGLLSALLNLLVLGSLLAGDDPGRIAPSALWWIPGSLVVSALLAGAGAAAGSRTAASGMPSPVEWLNGFAWVAVAATALLLAAGGLVTSAQAGLAVEDWPTSFGYNMFLYPFSKMTGGIYYEHAHRLLGALVGLTTVVLAAFTQAVETRRAVRRFAWAAVPVVVAQGILGGIRVTERELALAMVHGVLAQLFFAGLVVLAVVTSRAWVAAPTSHMPAASGAYRLHGVALIALTILQLVLGASQRHFSALLLGHVAIGLAVVTPLALSLGLRCFGLGRIRPRLARLGLVLVGALSAQVLLGFGALVVTFAREAGTLGRGWDLALSTAHQWFGAVLLAVEVVLVCRIFRDLADRASAPIGGREPLSTV